MALGSARLAYLVWSVRQSITVLERIIGTAFHVIGRLFDTGRLRAFVDSVLPIQQARQAFEQGLCSAPLELDSFMRRF